MNLHDKRTLAEASLGASLAHLDDQTAEKIFSYVSGAQNFPGHIPYSAPWINEVLAQQVGVKPTIFLTHDVDWISPYNLRSLSHHARAILGHKWFSPSALLSRKSLLKNTERLITFEKSKGINSTMWLLGMHDNSTIIKRHVHYNYSSPLTRELVQLLVSSGQNIQLHGISHKQEDHITEQAFLLKTMTGTTPYACRYHNLAFNEDRWKEMEKAGIHYELSAGHIRSIGFSNGYAGAFKGIDTRYERISSVKVIPMICADNAIVNYGAEKMVEAFKRAADDLEKYNGTANVLFHPENFLIFPELWDVYDRIIDICLQKKFIINPPL